LNERDAAGAAKEQRLDKWLWHARFVKSRNLAAKLIEDGAVRVNRRRVSKASVCVKCGDVLTATIHGQVRVIEILSIAPRRGAASEARALYRERLLASEGPSSENPEDHEREN
jgi:ribosome-associated heat shock protein Hsp15